MESYDGDQSPRYKFSIFLYLEWARDRIAPTAAELFQKGVVTLGDVPFEIQGTPLGPACAFELHSKFGIEGEELSLPAQAYIESLKKMPLVELGTKRDLAVFFLLDTAKDRLEEALDDEEEMYSLNQRQAKIIQDQAKRIQELEKQFGDQKRLKA
jgi:hypothetical protein